VALREAAVDFETPYTQEVSLKVMPTWLYSMHPETQAYMVSVWDGTQGFAGPPRDYDFRKLDGYTLWAHNAHFDGLVWQRLVRDRVIPSGITVQWRDTADLAAYRRHQRTLAGCYKVLTGTTLSKAKRSKAKDKTVAQLQADDWAGLQAYALKDAEACWTVRERLVQQWPQHEQHVSTQHREACWRGIKVDVALAQRYLDVLGAFLFKVEQSIPWDWAQEKTPLSRNAIQAQCQQDGIPCPSSFEKHSVECAQWEAEYADRLPWVRGIRYWRRVGFIRAKVRQLLEGLDEHGIYHYDMRYCGAQTGRFAAGYGDDDYEAATSNRFSVHGMPKFPIYVDPAGLRFHDGARGQPDGSGWECIDIRRLLVARDGHAFLIWDLAQIEPRLVHWATGNQALLDLIRHRGISVYQAEGETAYGWRGTNMKKEDPQMYAFIKTEYLGAQYQCGAAKLKMIAHRADIELSDERALEVITSFRAHNPRIPQMWARFLMRAKWCANRGDDYELELPSGRVLDYMKLHWAEGDYGQEVRGQYLKGAAAKKIYGGFLTNNLIQGTGRDVLLHKCRELEQEGFGWPLWTVHDEGINEIPLDQAHRLPEAVEIIRRDIPWAPGLPVDTEAQVSPFYMK